LNLTKYASKILKIKDGKIETWFLIIQIFISVKMENLSWKIRQN
jgi:hypothetical protein